MLTGRYLCENYSHYTMRVKGRSPSIQAVSIKYGYIRQPHPYSHAIGELLSKSISHVYDHLRMCISSTKVAMSVDQTKAKVGHLKGQYVIGQCYIDISCGPTPRFLST